jgi:hypothetical protein
MRALAKGEVLEARKRHYKPPRANCATAENTAKKQRVRQQMLVLRECRHPRSSARIESRMGTVAWAMRQRSVSDPRSSNWKCGFPASGCPTGFTVRHAQVCGTFKNYKSPSNRTKLQWNLNNIGVRSFILTGAPIKLLISLRHDRRSGPACYLASDPNNRNRPAMSRV